MKVKRIKKEQSFKSITIKIKIETREEFDKLYDLFGNSDIDFTIYDLLDDIRKDIDN